MSLEPCPFCGSADIRVVNDGPTSNRLHYGEQVYAIGCYQCGGSVPARFNKTLLVETWNTRAPDPRITELEQPCEPGSFAGDIWYGHPEKRTLGTHRWDGSAWQELPSEIEGCLSLLADARARIAALTAEVARKDEALRRLAYWFDTDADYLETLSEAECADNNRMLSIARAALEARND